jgi:hypothetical protein
MARLEIQGSQWPGQFCLCRDSREVSSDWPVLRLAGWVLRHCPTLPVAPLADAGGQPVGWLLGYPLSPDSRLIENACALETQATDANFAAAAEAWIARLAGRYAAILLAPSCARVYTDPGAQRPVVYHAAEQIVASSVCLAAPEPDWDEELMGIVDVVRRDGWYPFGLSPDRRVRRLLPNHRLDLDDFSAARFWPGPQDVDFGCARDIRESITRIAAKAEANIAAVAARHPLYISLTGGRDSRIILAICKDCLESVEFFTIGVPDVSGERDSRVASELARRFNLSHRVLSWIEPSPETLDAWQRRVGYSCAGRTWQSTATMGQLEPARAVMYGFFVEVGRCQGWRESDFSAGPLTPEELLERQKLPIHERLVVEAARWLAGLPLASRLDVLSLAHIELKMGCWSGVGFDGNTGRIVIPFCDREIFRLMLQLPPRYRFEQRMTLDLIRSRWPALLQLPFNREPGWRNAVAEWLGQQAREHPRLARAARKARHPFR